MCNSQILIQFLSTPLARWCLVVSEWQRCQIVEVDSCPTSTRLSSIFQHLKPQKYSIVMCCILGSRAFSRRLLADFLKFWVIRKWHLQNFDQNSKTTFQYKYPGYLYWKVVLEFWSKFCKCHFRMTQNFRKSAKSLRVKALGCRERPTQGLVHSFYVTYATHISGTIILRTNHNLPSFSHIVTSTLNTSSQSDNIKMLMIPGNQGRSH